MKKMFSVIVFASFLGQSFGLSLSPEAIKQGNEYKKDTKSLKINFTMFNNKTFSGKKISEISLRDDKTIDHLTLKSGLVVDRSDIKLIQNNITLKNPLKLGVDRFRINNDILRAFGVDGGGKLGSGVFAAAGGDDSGGG